MPTEQVKQYIPSAYASTAVTHQNITLFPVPVTDIANVCRTLYRTHGLPLKTLTGEDRRAEDGTFRVMYVFGVPGAGVFLAPYIELKNTTKFPSLVSEIHELFLYERKLKSFFGLEPEGHPDARPWVLHDHWPLNFHPLRKDVAWNATQKKEKHPYVFQPVTGEGVYQITVGPVHAGIIEPGHFQFNVAGEEILKLEAQLGYVHKGVEKLFETLPMEKKVQLAERVSGDSTVNQSLAFCQAVEMLSGVDVPKRAVGIRMLMAELERIANHLNDIGFIMLDTAFNFGGSQCARLREVVMQLNEKLSGSRFFRGMNVIGGVSQDISDAMLAETVTVLKDVGRELSEVLQVAEHNDILLDRLQRTGTVSQELVKDHGGVGIAARAVGLSVDARKEYPYALYSEMKFKVVTRDTGDVYARFHVRIGEVEQSISLVNQIVKYLASLHGEADTALKAPEKPLKKNSYAIGVTETWRGDVVYVVSTDADGSISSVQMRDPSFVNWPLVTAAVIGNIVPDFPLVNKSFNLSYTGNDL